MGSYSVTCDITRQVTIVYWTSLHGSILRCEKCAAAIYCLFASLGVWQLDCRVGWRLLAMTDAVISSDSAAIQMRKL